MTTHTIRQATIFISQSDGTAVYSSFDDIPVHQRRRLLESTTGPNSATIVIADRAGRAQIVRALRRRGEEGATHLMPVRYPWTEAFARRARAESPADREPRMTFPWRELPWTAFGLWAAAAGVLGWFCLRS